MPLKTTITNGNVTPTMRNPSTYIKLSLKLSFTLRKSRTMYASEIKKIVMSSIAINTTEDLSVIARATL